MSSTDSIPSEISKWDPGFTAQVMAVLRPILKAYHRVEVRGLDDFPPGGALVVSNHSGGLSRWTSRCSPAASTRSSATTGRFTRSATTC